MKLEKLLERMDYKVLAGSTDIEISTLVYDSRKVEKASVFVCISGAVSDAHDFIPDVVKKGAAAVVVEKDVTPIEGVTYIKVDDTRLALACMSAAYFDYPAEKIKTIGITGTKGKTTTTYMVKSILESAGIKTGLIGTIESICGDKRIPSANTTPESYRVQELFKEMVKKALMQLLWKCHHRLSCFTEYLALPLILVYLQILSLTTSESMSTRILQTTCIARAFYSDSAGLVSLTEMMST